MPWMSAYKHYWTRKEHIEGINLNQFSSPDEMLLRVKKLLEVGVGGKLCHTQGEVEGSGLGVGGLQTHTRGEVEGSGIGVGFSRPIPRGVSRPTPRGEVKESSLGGSPGLHLGVSMPTPRGGLQGHAQGEGVGIPACTEADPPASRRLLLRAVRILLECILVLLGDVQ